MTNYRRGAYFELAVKAELESRGALVVRAAGSHGAVDLVAIWPAAKPPGYGEGPWLIQCKTSRARLGPAERRELAYLGQRYQAEPILAFRLKPGWAVYARITNAGQDLETIEIIRLKPQASGPGKSQP